MAYVYRHIRLDKNVPFYIGIGLKEDDFRRAYDKRGRNEYWNNIVSKTEYDVEIIFENISNELAYKKEKEFISIHKRHKDGGTLCNLTLGGEGQVGMIPWNFGKETPEETKRKQSIKKIGKPSNRKGVKISQHVIDSMRKGREGKSAWNKGIPISQDAKDKYKKTMEGRVLKGENHPMYGTKMPQHVKDKLREANKNRPSWNKGMKGQYKMPPNQHKKRVIKYSLDGVFICEYESATEAALSNNGVTKDGVSACSLGRIKFHKGFIWKYK